MRSFPLVLLMACTSPDELLTVNLIPEPSQLEVVSGWFELDPGTVIAVSEGVEEVGERLAEILRPSTGLPLEVVVGSGEAGDITLSLDETLAGGLGAEGYTLDSDRDQVRIVAATPAGLFYGCQTLRQMLPAAIESRSVVEGDWRVAAVSITDRPRFGWRGSMIDVARHFFGPEEIRRHIDLMALHKLNRLHLHLTDDQGWRLEIRSWPDLTRVGGATEVGGTEGGFYTQEEYAQIVAYAGGRFVTVVPEIDMPGHVNAALASYGELNASGEPTAPYTGIGVGFSSLWLEGEITRTFVRDVLTEVAALTPGPYLHVGGDESDATDPDAYAAFLRWVQGVVGEQGKTLVGWDEIADADLEAPFFGQYWIRLDRASAIAQGGGQVIASPAGQAYLDMRYRLDTPVGTVWAGLTDTRDAYEWDPVPEGVDPGAVAGVEAPLWTETTATWQEVELLVWPRLAGHAELGWSDANRDWESYRVRLGAHGERLDALGVAFFRSPLVDWAPR